MKVRSLLKNLCYFTRTHAERAIELMLRLLPEDHLLLSSSKRVKALILEEMAIDNPNKDVGRCQYSSCTLCLLPEQMRVNTTE